ncbi:MAG: chemotaxis protein CheW [Polyangia bacterium]
MPGSSDEPVLVVGLESGIYAIRLGHVREIMRPLSTEVVAGAPSFVLGVTRVRGEPAPVVDLARFIADGPALPRPDGRWIRVDLRGRSLVLSVDSVRGVRHLAAEVLSALPSLLAGAERNAVEKLALLDEELVRVLDSGLRMPDDVWSALEGMAS